MSHLAALMKVDQAVAKSDSISPMAHFVISGGRVRGTDGRMTADAAWPGEEEFAVPAAEFRKALRVLDVGCTFTRQDNDTMVIRKGRFSVTCNVLPIHAIGMIVMPDGAEWLPVPRNLQSVLRLQQHLMSENKMQTWACAVTCDGTTAWVTNNMILAISTLDAPVRRMVIPDHAVEYIASRQEQLKSYAVAQGRLSFEFEDGSVLTTSVPAAEPPETAQRMLENLPDAEMVLTDEFKTEYDKLSQLGETTIVIGPQGLRSGKGKSLTECAFATDVPEETMWGKKYLDLVMTVCKPSHLDFHYWPKPAPFRSENIRGLIVGARAA